MAVDVVSPVLVARTAELALLHDAVARTRAGSGATVLVAGEAGVGKSRLLHAALDDAAGVRVLAGGCIELGGEGLPLVPLVEALRTLARTTGAQELDRLLGPARGELGRLLPELAAPGVGPAHAGGTTAQLFELLLGVLARLAEERPLVLVVEDLHWADRSTVDLVSFLVRALVGLPVLLVLTYRSDEVDRRSPLRSVLSGWERVREVVRLQLSRFDRDAVAAQIGAILGAPPDPALVDLVFDRSEGNAFFVEELLRAVRDGAAEAQLPPSLRDVLLSRVEQLSPAAQRLLRTAAVAGRWVPERLLAQVAAVPTAELYDGLREAVDASLLVVDRTGRGYAFRHALTRDAVYAELLPGERVELHLAYGEALAADPGLAGDDASVAATLAVHWYAAHDLPRALAASVRAGRQALDAFAPAEARRHLERALEVWRSVPDARERAGADQVDVVLLAARAAYRAGDTDRALPLLDRARELLGPEPDPERMAQVVVQEAAALRTRAEDGSGVARLRQAIADLPEDPPTEARAAALVSLASGLMRLDASQECLQVAQTALAASRAVHARALEADVLVTIGLVRSYTGDPLGGEASLREGLDVALSAGHHETACRGYVNLSDLLEARGRHAEAAATAREGVALASRVGLTRTFGAYLTGNVVEPLVRLGEWAEAERMATATLRGGLIGVFAASLHEQLGYVAAQTGRLDQALEQVDQARRQLRGRGEQQFSQALHAIEADVDRARGDLAGAAAHVAQGLTEGSGWAARYAWPLVWVGARAEADAAVLARDRHHGSPPVATDAVTREAEAALEATLGSAGPAARAYRATAAAERARGAAAGQVPAWRDAVERWRDAPDAWPLSYALFRLAEALCADGDREAAAAPLREAAAGAQRLGAAPLLSEVQALGRRARLPLSGEEPAARPEGPAGPAGAVPFGLTEREREVLALVAAGRTNGQIAKALFISPKTASVHVSNILAKLGVAGRTEAAAVAHRLGLTGGE